MHLKIHRGTEKIGGSCVEIWTKNTRILVDFGMPLVEKGGKEFDFTKYKDLPVAQLVDRCILPDLKGVYKGSKVLIDGVLISHPHQDHYGLFHYIDPAVQRYLGKATHKLIEINNIFTPQDIPITNPVHFEKEVPFRIGDISITPYWADHSAFDSYSFLIEADACRIFYSGDFRGHGRKANVFRWFIHNAPVDVDYLLLEGTSLGRDSGSFRNEWNIEREFEELFRIRNMPNVVYTSGQNIDRIVSLYRACVKTGKILVVDVYLATILKELASFAKIPYPSKEFDILRVIYPFFTSRRLKKQGDERILYQFRYFKITKDEINAQPDNYVILVRPSMQKDLKYISGLKGGHFIYSMWQGYKSKPATVRFMKYFESNGFDFHDIHTSGHADIPTLKKMVEALNPGVIIPIHTFHPKTYKDIFSSPVRELTDGEEIAL